MRYRFNDEIIKKFNNFHEFGDYLRKHTNLTVVMPLHKFFYIYEPIPGKVDLFKPVEINPLFLELYSNCGSFKAIIGDFNIEQSLKINARRINKKIIDTYFTLETQLIYPDE